MKKYYTHNGNEQLGPFTLEELKAKQITRNEMIWFESLSDWKKAGEIEELNSIFASVPPPFAKATPPPAPKITTTQKEPNPTKVGGLWKIIRNAAILIGIAIGILFIISIVQRSSSGATSPLKIAVNPPSPRIVESHTAEDGSSELFAYRQGVWATVLNEGGAGKVLVKATLYQGGKFMKEARMFLLALTKHKNFTLFSLNLND